MLLVVGVVLVESGFWCRIFLVNRQSRGNKLGEINLFFLVSGSRIKNTRDLQYSRTPPLRSRGRVYVPSSEDMVLRPKGKKAVKYDRIVGISKSYQYFALNAGAVAMRRHRCCCEACLPTAITPQARPRRVRRPSHEARLYHILPATRPSQQPPLVPRLAALGIGGA